MTPEERLAKAEELRENDQLKEALKLNSEVVEETQKLKNWRLLCQASLSRVLVFKHLYLISKNKEYALKALDDARMSVEIAEEKGLNEMIGSSNFRVGEIEMILGNYELAESSYRLALDKFVGSNAERGDFTYHLGEAIYKKGNKDEGRKIMIEGLTLIQANRSEVDPFLIHVWESGCYMRLSEAFRDDSIEKAKAYLEEARKIIESDDKLVIRKRQLKEFENQLN